MRDVLRTATRQNCRHSRRRDQETALCRGPEKSNTLGAFLRDRRPYPGLGFTPFSPPHLKCLKNRDNSWSNFFCAASLDTNPTRVSENFCRHQILLPATSGANSTPLRAHDGAPNRTPGSRKGAGVSVSAINGDLRTLQACIRWEVIPRAPVVHALP